MMCAVPGREYCFHTTSWNCFSYAFYFTFRMQINANCNTLDNIQSIQRRCKRFLFLFVCSLYLFYGNHICTSYQDTHILVVHNNGVFVKKKNIYLFLLNETGYCVLLCGYFYLVLMTHFCHTLETSKHKRREYA